VAPTPGVESCDVPPGGPGGDSIDQSMQRSRRWMKTLPHFLAIEFGVFPAIDGHWRVEGASDLDFLEVLQRRQYQSNPKQSKACDEIHVSDIHMLHRWYVYQHLPPTKWFK